MEDKRYTYAVAYIRALETGLLTSQIKTQLLETEDEENLFRILSGTSYAAGKDMLEQKLIDESIKTIALLKKLSLDFALTELLSLKYDFYNIKILLKNKHFPQDKELLLIEGGNLNLEELKDAITENKMRSLPTDYVDAIGEAEAEFDRTNKLSMIDIVLDKEFGNIFYRRSLEYGNKFFIEFARMFSDLSNIRNFFRIRNRKHGKAFLEKVLLAHGKLDKKLFLSFIEKPVEDFAAKLTYTDYFNLVREGVEYWKEKGSLARIERTSDEYLLNFAKTSRYTVFGPEPLFAYSVMKDNEIKSIRIIVFGKTSGVPVDMIRERIAF